tara:strand:+ start:588 stop:2435 length:1848 start_codon:yes stop_codon:yes gene_type:complete
MARKETKLNLQAELPEVRSTDFNLFYRPEQAPVDKSVAIFTRSIDNFVNGAGTAMVLSAEKKEKELNEAEAIEQFNKNRSGFNDAVKRGEIPKEANPYFQEKYKELTLNKKAKEFQANIYQKYAEMNVLDNPDPQAFDKFYNDELKNFLTENNLGAFDALQLEKGFFSETSKTRNSLFNTHVQSQMSKIGEDYKRGFKESIQGKFDKNRSNEEIGADISAFVQDATKNGLSNSTAQKYLLESLEDWSKTTGDLEFAERLLRDLPNYLKLGTDSLSNVKGLQNDLDILKENIDTRILQKEKDEITKLNNERTRDVLEASEFANKYDTFSEAIQDPDYPKFSKNKQAEIFKEIESREQGFDSQTDPRVEEDFYSLLEQNKIVEAKEFLRKNIPNMTSNKYSNLNEELKGFEFTKKDGLLASGYFNYWKDEIESITKSTNKGKFALSQIDPLEHKKFEANMKVWLNDNQLENFKNNTERKEAFEKYVKSEYDKVFERAINSDGTSLTDGDIDVDGESSTPVLKDGKQKKIKANIEELTDKVEKPKVNKIKSGRGGAKPENRAEDPELKIDLAKVNIIPNGLSRGERAKFLRENDNTISQDEYDRIFKKQNDIKLAKGN